MKISESYQGLPVSNEEYLERLALMSEIELGHEQEENFVELLFILISSESLKRESPNISNEKAVEMENSIISIRSRIKAAKDEILSRDNAIEVLVEREIRQPQRESLQKTEKI